MGPPYAEHCTCTRLLLHVVMCVTVAVQTRITSVTGVLGPPCVRQCTCTLLIAVYRHEGPVWQVCWVHPMYSSVPVHY